MRLWDADAISQTLRDETKRVILGTAILSGQVRIAGTTLTELCVGKPSQEATTWLRMLFETHEHVEVPVREDFLVAGGWLNSLPIPKTLTKGQKQDARLRLTMDAILAAVAWRREWSVVTYNLDDFKRIKGVAKCGRIETPEDVLPDALPSL